jgi:hypothetical protein
MRRIKHKKTATINPSINYTDWNDWLVDENNNIIDLDQVTDDFLSGGTTAALNGLLGTLSWSITPGTVASKAGELNHPGIVLLASGATQYNITRLYLATSAINPSMMLDNMTYIAFIIRPSLGTTVMSVRAGFTQSLTTTDDGAQGAYWSFNTLVDNYWGSVTRDAGGITRNPTNIPYELSKWYLLEIKRNGNNLEFWLNNSLKFNHSTNITTLGLFPFIAVQTNETSNKTIDIDYFAMNTIINAQRWT